MYLSPWPCLGEPAGKLGRFLILCDLAGKKPDAQFWYDGNDGTPRKHVERYWHLALDEPDRYYHYTSEPPF